MNIRKEKEGEEEEVMCKEDENACAPAHVGRSVGLEEKEAAGGKDGRTERKCRHDGWRPEDRRDGQCTDDQQNLQVLTPFCT